MNLIVVVNIMIVLLQTVLAFFVGDEDENENVDGYNVFDDIVAVDDIAVVQSENVNENLNVMKNLKKILNVVGNIEEYVNVVQVLW